MSNAKDRRAFKRVRLHDPENVKLTFSTQNGQNFICSVWDYSRFGLGVILHNGYTPEPKYSLNNCEISAFGRTISLGEASITRIKQENGQTFLGLYLFKEFVDMDALIEKKTLRIQTDELNNLKMHLGYGTNIKEEFKSFSASFAFGLSVYKKYLDDIDAKFHKEPESLKKNLFDSVMAGIGKELWNFLNTEINKLKVLVKDYSKIENEKHGFFLRRILWNFIIESEFIKRTNVKPRGYAGDSEMMEMIYRQEYRGRSSFGKIFHKHPIETKAAQAVRNRRKLIVSELENLLASQTQIGTMQVLSVACGPAWELQDFFSDSPNRFKIKAVLLDQDSEALKEAKSGIESIKTDSPFDVSYLKESVRTILRSSNPEISFGKYHYIYSMGLYDYLTDPVAKVLTEKLYSMLLPGGKLIIGNYHVKNETRLYMEYIMDWVLFYRDEESMLELTSEFPGEFHVEVGLDSSDTQMFLKVIKKNE